MSIRSQKPHIFTADRAPIAVPFLIIAIAVGVLSYRSYRLAVRMEGGIQSFALEYLHYAAEITAERVDTLVHARMFGASEQWQRRERMVNTPSAAELGDWIRENPWITSAIYIPDDDPLGTVYVTQPAPTQPEEPKTQEFFSATGTVRYTFLPSLLVSAARREVDPRRDPHLALLRETEEVRRRSSIEIIRHPAGEAASAGERFSVIVPLAEPLSGYAVRASIDDAYIGAGWENHRVVSVWLATIALALVVIATLLASRGLKKEAETIRLRSALIANVSHELRTPLSMIRLGIETLRRNPKLQESPRAEIEEAVHRETMHLSHLVENVLDVARMEKSGVRLVLAPVDPAELVQTLVSNYQPWLESKGFEASVRIDAGIPEQMWDREAISRALLNLIDNAVKYSDQEKSIEIVVRDGDDHVEIAVRDRGVGMHSKDIRRIFEPYYRARFSDTETRRGAGLGLTLVQQIVKAHRGEIEVQSSRGRGSTFTMWLPKGSAGRPRTRISPTGPSLASDSGENR